VVSPLRFLRLVERIRNRFNRSDGLRTDLNTLSEDVRGTQACSAAVAALVNTGFLKWTEDERLVKAEIECDPPKRRTA